MKFRPPKRLVVPFLVWDTVWKFLAIRRAIQLRKWAWIAPLAVSGTAGLLPIFFLLRNPASPAPETTEAS